MSFQFIKLFLIILLSFLTLVSGETFSQFVYVSKKLIEHDVTPDVIDVVPSGNLQVSYPSGAVVNFGNELTPTEVQGVPFVFWIANPFSYYTLIMTDPDVPNRKDHSLGEVCHWIVVNIPGSNVNRGQIITDFIGSGAPKDTGLHRYIFLVFEQPSGRLQFNETFLPKYNLQRRLGFKTRNFVAKYNLGNPVAGNLYQAQFDPYVLRLHASFTE